MKELILQLINNLFVKPVQWMIKILTPVRKKYVYPPEYTQFRIMWQERPSMYIYMLFGYDSIKDKWFYLTVTSSVNDATFWTEDYNCCLPRISEMEDHVSVFAPSLKPRNQQAL